METGKLMIYGATGRAAAPIGETDVKEAASDR